MSIKSLLQIILILLIFIIIGGIYFIYFYSVPNKNKKVGLSGIDENVNLSVDKVIIDNNEAADKNDLSISNVENSKKVNDNEKAIEEKQKNNKFENLTKQIQYITSSSNGDVFKILADTGKTNLKNRNLLNLENVKGSIISPERPDIYISSKFAEYNYSNQNSKFYNNVIIKYNDQIIKCDNLDLKISDNIAIAYNNVILQDKNSIMNAEKITMNILTKDININSDNEIEITKN
tara:strand:- start:373 stop:1074 length:702 start_codon:yes stop_codon:yes gene_type:complete